MRPWLSLTTFLLCPTKTATEPEICSFKKYKLFAALQLWSGRSTYSLKKSFFSVDGWVVKDRGGECYSTLSKKFAIFSPNILLRSS